MSAKPAQQRATISEKIVDLWELYANTEDIIDYHGIAKICKDCGISPGTDPKVLILMWKCDCKTYGVIRRNEFMTGLEALRAYDI
jgi:hypothetical protein